MHDVASPMLRAESRLVKPSAMRGVLILLVLATTVSAAVATPAARKPKHTSHADTTTADATPAKPVVLPAPAGAPAAAPAAPDPEAAKATALLDKIVAGPDAAARKAAITELDALAPHTVEAIGGWLARAHQAEVADR